MYQEDERNWFAQRRLLSNAFDILLRSGGQYGRYQYSVADIVVVICRVCVDMDVSPLTADFMNDLAATLFKVNKAIPLKKLKAVNSKLREFSLVLDTLADIIEEKFTEPVNEAID